MQPMNISPHTSTLKNGSTVIVQVLSKGKGNEYSVRFGGNTISVYSQKQLHVGTSFKAFVTIKNGKVFLSPQAEKNTSAIQKISSGGAEAVEKLSGLLLDLGLKSDSISLRTIQYFQSTGLTFNIKLALKARTIGVQFPGREEDATEVALFLEQRGIHADADSVMGILGVLDGGNSEYNDSNEEPDGDEDQEDCIDTQQDDVGEENEGSFDINLLNFLYDDSANTYKNKEGLLTYVNQYCTKNPHWLILPFEYEEKANKVTGNIRILLNFTKKNTEKMVISAFSSGRNYKFMIKCEDKGDTAKQQRYDIRFCLDKNDTSQTSQQLCDMLSSCLPSDVDFDISYSDELLSDGIFTLSSTISVVKLEA